MNPGNPNNHLSFGNNNLPPAPDELPDVKNLTEYQIQTNSLSDSKKNSYPITSKSSSVSYNRARKMLSKAIREID